MFLKIINAILFVLIKCLFTLVQHHCRFRKFVEGFNCIRNYFFFLSRIVFLFVLWGLLILRCLLIWLLGLLILLLLGLLLGFLFFLLAFFALLFSLLLFWLLFWLLF